jgi:dihydroflavonol-4-reductase
VSTVLVTGGSGFLGCHVLAQVLSAGHDARTTVRSSKREPEVRAMLKEAGVEAGERLRFYAADLASDDGWAEAVRGCDYVQHVASPIPAAQPRDENELIVPARDGAVRVLRAARDAGVKRVVFTSTCGAIYYGHPSREAPFDETSWSKLEGTDMSAYVKSKVLAERAVWEFMKHEGGALELSVVNPCGIFGPVLGKDASSSIEIIARLMKGMPGCPRVYFAVVDVRDVADLQLRAMTAPEAKGERFIASAGPSMSMLEIANVLRARLPAASRKVPTRELPSWLVRFAALFSPELRTVLPMLDRKRSPTSAKAQRVLGWKPRSPEDALVATAESLARYGVLPA